MSAFALLELLDALGGILVEDSGAFGGDLFFLAHHEIVAVGQPAQAMTRLQAMCAHYASLAILALHHHLQPRGRIPTDHHINIVIDGGGSRVGGSQGDRLVGELKVSGAHLALGRRSTPLARCLPLTGSGLHLLKAEPAIGA